MAERKNIIENPTASIRPEIQREIAHRLAVSAQNFKLTLAVAPAGYGKSFAARQAVKLLEENSVPVLDIALRDSNSKTLGPNDSPACQFVVSGCSQTSEEVTPDLNSITQTEGNLVVLIDLQEHLEIERLDHDLSRLINESPEGVSIVLFSRVIPSIDLQRMLFEERAQVFENQDFRLKNEEIKELTAIYHRSTAESAEFTASVFEKTKGWPTAVALYLRLFFREGNNNGSIEEFDDIISSFLHEIVREMPPELLEFSAKLAALGQFSKELINHIFEDGDSHKHIDQLYRFNFFISRVVGDSKSYRFHPLVRDYLLRSQWLRDEGASAELCSKAAIWASDNNRDIDAIEYAFRGNNLPLALELIEGSIQIVAEELGFFQKVVEWCEKVPLVHTPSSIELHFWFTWCLTFTAGYDQVRKNIKNLESLVSDRSMFSEAESQEYTIKLEALKIPLLLLTGEHRESHRLSEIWQLKYAEVASPFDDTLVSVTRSMTSILELDSFTSRESILNAKKKSRSVNALAAAMWASALEGIYEMEFGNGGVARAVLRDVYLRGNQERDLRSPSHSSVALFYARACYELGETDGLNQLLEYGLRYVATHGAPESAYAGIMVDFRLAQKIGHSEALQSLSKAEKIGALHSSRFQFYVHNLRVQEYLRVGSIQLATEEAVRAGVELKDKSFSIRTGDEPIVTAERELLAIKVLFAKERYKTAAESMKALLSKIETSRRPRFSIECLLLDSAILLKTNEKISALRQFNKALKKSIKHNFFQVFIDNSLYTKPALEEVVKLRVSDNILQEDKLIQRISDELSITSNRDTSIENVELKFSEREVELLRLLQSSLNVQEIADYLFLSKSTVKWHLNNIYKKLSVKNRSGANDAARKFNII